jgi:flavin-dependent dehydrogenase
MTMNEKYDIIILGGGVAGSVMAISLKRKNSALKILMIERSAVFPNKVGESSADLTGLFFNRFNLDHVVKKQLQKTGLRFLFNEHNSRDFSLMDEFSSPARRSIANGYQFNRQEFDEDLLLESKKLGVEILRPAEIMDFNFKQFDSEVTVKHNERIKNFQATWLIDASGPARIVGKKMGWGRENLDFDTAAVFAHFENLKPFEEWDKAENKYWDKHGIGPRSQSTIHFLRDGCWWWYIALNNNTTSLGVVYDKNKFGNIDGEKFFTDYLRDDAQLHFITEGSTRSAIRQLPKLPYLSNQLYVEGVCVIGDAAAFIDPLFSPGIEFTCQQSIWLTELIAEYFVSKKMNERKWKRYEKIFLRAFENRILLYRDRYKLMGSYDLFSNWVQLDFFGYYGFTINPALFFPKKIKYPPRFIFPSNYVYKFFTNRYLKISKRRKLQGRLSKCLKKPVSLSHVSTQAGWKLYFKPLQLFSIWFGNYLRIEMHELKYFLFRK